MAENHADRLRASVDAEAKERRTAARAAAAAAKEEEEEIPNEAEGKVAASARRVRPAARPTAPSRRLRLR